MSKNPIEMVKEAIKFYEDEQARLKSRVSLLAEDTRTAERELFDVKNIKQKFEASLKCLEEAKELEEKKPIKEE